MPDFTRRWRSPIRAVGDGRYRVELDEQVRQLLGGLVDDLSALLDDDDPSLVRLFPPAYGDDDERNEGYALLAGSELRDHRRQALATVSETIEATELDEEQLSAWMRSVNDLRLFLGTKLGIDDEGSPPPIDEEGAATHSVYELLGVLLEAIVAALTD